MGGRVRVLGLCVTAGLTPMVAVGAAIAHRVPAAHLRLLVAVVLCVSTVFFITKLAVDIANDEADGSAAAS